MRRLVYAPKVWIFIRSSNILQDDGTTPMIFDVSSDIVRGSVTQNLGDVSKARFELRNRGWKWTRFKHDNSDYDMKQVFLPMDLVTIWMQRIAGRPIQVFTGYLDSVPYYQAYPGTAVFEATCTLKKLAYNWFDPGLTTFVNWLEDNGWTYDRGTGQVNLGPVGPEDPTVGLGQSGSSAGLAVSDVNMGQLIGRFMVDIAGWDPNEVVISNLPVDIAEEAAYLKTQLEGAFESARAEATSLMSTFLGIHGAEGLASQVDQSPLDKITDANTKTPNKNLPTVQRIINGASMNNIPGWIPMLASLVLSGMNPTRQVKKDTGDVSWGYGLYSMRPNSEIKDSKGQTIYYIDGQPISNVLDVGVATDLFCRRLSQNKGGNSKLAIKNNDGAAAFRWIEQALGWKVSLAETNLALMVVKAQQLAGTQEATKLKEAPKPAVKPSETPPTSDVVQKQLTDDEKKLIKSTYKTLAPEMGFVILAAKSFSKSLKLSKATENLNTNQIYLRGQPGLLQRFFNSLKGNPLYSKVEMFANGESQVLQGGASKSGAPSSLKELGIIVTGNIEELRKRKETVPTVQDSTETVGGGDTGEAGITMQQLTIFAANSAFAAQLAFDTNVALAETLKGEKALLNDTPCIDAIKQFCQASLRTFRSLPDGRFLTFYPDYFGRHRTPYWKIRDIEIIDFGIQLNDQALATHVYIIGDSITGSPGGSSPTSPEILNSQRTEGVATILQKNMLESFIASVDKSDSGVHRLQDGIDFINHYGNRPHKESMPLIRNRDYEFLMAWQKFMWLWSQQFATTVEFTFQPEVMAGGLIDFPDHHIQMFCDSVTHNFDYTSGFTTQAVLTAPSITITGDNKDMPGFALAGGTNTVGVAG